MFSQSNLIKRSIIDSKLKLIQIILCSIYSKRMAINHMSKIKINIKKTKIFIKNRITFFNDIFDPY